VVELEFSHTWSLPDALAEALHRFEKREGIAVHVDILDHTREQRQLSDFAIFRTGPDVSEVGTTWLSSLISMGALSDFPPWEVDALKRGGAFFLPAWQPGVERGATLAIPWRTDTRVIYYRRDLLHQAGIDEATAFATVNDLRQTLTRLQALPGVLPCIIPTNRQPILLHVLAPWVWLAGGKFLREDGRKTLFAEPEALAGIVNYFDTFAPVLAPAAQGMSDNEVCAAFLTGRTAVTITGNWLLDSVQQQADTLPDIASNLGLALTPGAQYRGGMSLVIWQHSRHPKEAIKLIRFLTDPAFQTTDLRRAGHLPARQQALDSPPFTTDPHFRLIGESLRSAQEFNAVYLWGLVEDRLTTAISALWQQIAADPNANVRDLVAGQLKPLAARLNRTLSAG